MLKLSAFRTELTIVVSGSMLELKLGGSMSTVSSNFAGVNLFCFDLSFFEGTFAESSFLAELFLSNLVLSFGS